MNTYPWKETSSSQPYRVSYLKRLVSGGPETEYITVKRLVQDSRYVIRISWVDTQDYGQKFRYQNPTQGSYENGLYEAILAIMDLYQRILEAPFQTPPQDTHIKTELYDTRLHEVLIDHKSNIHLVLGPDTKVNDQQVRERLTNLLDYLMDLLKLRMELKGDATSCLP